MATSSPAWQRDGIAGVGALGRRYPYLASSQAGVALLETVKQADLPGLGARLSQGLSQGAGWKVPTLLLTGDSDKYIKVRPLPLHHPRPCPPLSPGLPQGPIATHPVRKVDLGSLMVAWWAAGPLHRLDTALYLSAGSPGTSLLEATHFQSVLRLQCSGLRFTCLQASYSGCVPPGDAWFDGTGADPDRKAHVLP